MGQLATYLQQQFQAHCPPVWQVQREAQLLADDLRQMLGYAPQVDVLLAHETGHRLWLEFEISRADPVANHAKFATAHLFHPQTNDDIFVSMVTPHVTAGRRNLAANMVHVMRYIGMQAFQTTLFPTLPPQEIRRLNHLDPTALRQENLNVRQEIQRALDIAHPLRQVAAANIYFVANNTEAILNLHRWNRDIQTRRGQDLWGRRTITYFVYDPRSHLFAPSKFCAYVAIARILTISLPTDGSSMTIEDYVQIDHGEPVFDGQRAHKHLVNNLGMQLIPADNNAPDISRRFAQWLRPLTDHVCVHPVGASFLAPPAWF